MGGGEGGDEGIISQEDVGVVKGLVDGGGEEREGSVLIVTREAKIRR